MEHIVICWISFAAIDSARHEHGVYHTKSKFKRLKCGDKVYTRRQRAVHAKTPRHNEQRTKAENCKRRTVQHLHSHQKLSGVDSLYATISSCVCIVHDGKMFARNVLNDNQRVKAYHSAAWS